MALAYLAAFAISVAEVGSHPVFFPRSDVMGANVSSSCL